MFADTSALLWSMVRAVDKACAPLDVEVTFPVKASLVGIAREQLAWLVNQSPRYSLTLWHHEGDEPTEQYVKAIRSLADALRSRPGRLLYDGPVNDLLVANE